MMKEAVGEAGLLGVERDVRELGDGAAGDVGDVGGCVRRLMGHE